MKFLLALLFVLQTVLPAYAGTGKVIQTDNIESIKATKNYIGNGLAQVNTTGWSTYADAAGTRPVDGTSGTPNVTWTRSTTSPLSDAGSFIFTKDAANRQGQGASFDFTIDSKDQAKVLKVEMDYIVNSGTFAAGSSTTDSDVIVYLYDVTNSRLIEPSTFKLYTSSTSLPDKYQGYFQTNSDSTSYRLIFHVATTSASAWALKIDNVAVSPSEYAAGTIITDWKSFSPTGSWTTNTTYVGKYRQVGDSAEIQVNLALAGAPTAADLTINLPTGLTMDTSKITVTGAQTVLGSAEVFDSGNRFYVGGTIYLSSTSVGVMHTESGNFGQVNATNPITFGSADAVSVNFKVPIVGWSAGAQMSDGYDGRVVAARLGKTANQSIPNGSFTKVVWDSANLNQTGIASVTNSRFEIKSAGTYVFNSQIFFDTNATGMREMVLYKNGGAVNFSLGNRSGVGSDVRLNGTSAPIDAVAGDYFEIYVYQNSGGALNINGSFGESYTYFGAYKLPGSPTISATAITEARYTTGSGQSIANGGISIVNFGTKVTDTMGSVTTGGSWKFTAQEYGIYNVAALIRYANSVSWSSGQYLAIHIYKNGSAYSRQDYLFQATITPAQGPSVSINDDIELLAGEYIDIRAAHGESSARSLVAADVFNRVVIKKVK